MIDILKSKRESSRFQILVEIAAHQPNMRQKEVADRLELTPQAISEYIKELVSDGLVTADGRMLYRITKEGVEWLLERAADLKQYARMVTEDIISNVSVWSTLAETDIHRGEKVSLQMRSGLLYANKKEGIDAAGIAISDASAGEDLGVSDLKGLISLDAGKIALCKVPRIQAGGSRNVDMPLLKERVSGKMMVGALGIEAIVALRKAGREPDIIFGAGEASVDAAFHGIDSVIVSVDEQIPRILKRLESDGLKYELIDLTLS